MEAFGNAVSAVAVLLVLTLVGYLMGKLGWLGPAEKKFLGRYIINIAVPCNCISGVLGRLDRDMLGEAGWLLLLAFGLMIICLLFASLLAALLRLPKNRRGIFISMSGMSSCLFVGLPLGTQLFGDVCIPYVMIYYLANAGGFSEGSDKKTPDCYDFDLRAAVGAWRGAARRCDDQRRIYQRFGFPPGADLHWICDIRIGAAQPPAGAGTAHTDAGPSGCGSSDLRGIMRPGGGRGFEPGCVCHAERTACIHSGAGIGRGLWSG